MLGGTAVAQARHSHRSHRRHAHHALRRPRPPHERRLAEEHRQARERTTSDAHGHRRGEAKRGDAGNAAAAIAAVLAAPCQNTEVTPAAGNLAVVREAIMCLINHERAEHGELPLAANPDLQAAAEGHDREMIDVDYFAHVSPSGVTPVDRIRETGYIASSSDGYVLGENLAWGTYDLATPRSIVEAWIASPGHLANILESQYRETGIAIVPDVPESLAQGAPGATYAQEFGVLIH
jgi:uncharacterized protein YkwD